MTQNEVLLTQSFIPKERRLGYFCIMCWFQRTADGDQKKAA
jgi:hypothetical protein